MNPFVLSIIAVVVGFAVLDQSSKKNEETFWQKRATQKDPPAHGWVGNQPSSSAWAWCLLIAIVGAFIIAKTSGF